MQTLNEDPLLRSGAGGSLDSFVREGAFGTFTHQRELPDVHHQTVVRMSRDTLCSAGVFDLESGAVTVRLPDPQGRFMSLLAINGKHQPLAAFHDSQPHRITRKDAGTRHLYLIARTYIDPSSPADLQVVHALQDGIRARQEGAERFERSGAPRDWRGHPVRDVVSIEIQPPANDGRTVHRMTVRDVPVDGFWSVSVYNRDGFFEPNPRGAYSLDSLVARRDSSGACVIQFGGCAEGVENCLPITPGWNYVVRLYWPRPEVLDGRWSFPDALPVH